MGFNSGFKGLKMYFCARAHLIFPYIKHVLYKRYSYNNSSIFYAMTMSKADSDSIHIRPLASILLSLLKCAFPYVPNQF